MDWAGSCAPNMSMIDEIPPSLPVEKTSSEFTFWQVELNAVSIDSTKLTFDGGSVALLDTGSTFIGVSTSMLKQIAAATNAQVYDQDLYLIDCRSTKRITFTLAGVDFPLDGRCRCVQ